MIPTNTSTTRETNARRYEDWSNKTELVQNALEATRNVSRTREKGNGLRLSVRQNILVGIRAGFAYRVRIEFISRNPPTNVDTPKVSQREYPNFPIEVANLFFKAVLNAEFLVIDPFALFTGARRAEIAALRWSNVDRNRGRYSVRRSAAIVDGKQIEKVPKSQHPRRTEALPPCLIILLKRHQRD